MMLVRSPIVSTIMIILNAVIIRSTPLTSVETYSTTIAFYSISIATVVNDVGTWIPTRYVNLAMLWRFQFRALDFCDEDIVSVSAY